MYKISVPIVLGGPQLDSRERTLEELEKLGAERVFLAPGAYITDEKRLSDMLARIARETEYFHERGYEVGVWLWAAAADGDLPYECVRSLSEKALHRHYCMADPDFRAYAGDYIAKVAKCGVDMIIFDDDMRYGQLSNGVNCFCAHHMADISRILGRTVTLEELRAELFTGATNEYRRAWMASKANALRAFARDTRAALDRETPDVRLGFCTCITNWSCEGVTPMEISKILAGNTPPFLRLSAAPYWASRGLWGNNMQSVIELSRLEIELCRGSGIEIFGEGDVFPRPRYKVSAAYLEMLDIALRANGGTSGIAKYALDYNSTPDYEMGYTKRHVRNLPLYEQVSALFADKSAVGTRIYYSMDKLLHKTYYEGENPEHVVDHALFAPSARLCADSAIPTVYAGDGIGGIAFGEDVNEVPREAMKRGLVIDLTAAEILISRGIDVGIAHVGDAVTLPKKEYFIRQKEYSRADIKAYLLDLKDGAEIDSEFICKTPDFGEMRVPSAFFYENAEGDRFFVFNFRMYYGKPDMWRSYARARQVRAALERLSGMRLPAFIAGNPDVYLLTKRAQNGALAVGIFNLNVDSLIDAELELGEAYASAKCIACEGTLVGDIFRLGDIPPFSFAAVLLEK